MHQPVPQLRHTLTLLLLAATTWSGASGAGQDGRSADAADRPAVVLLAQAGAARPAAAAVQADLEALIKGARAEGEVTFYIALVESVGKRAADGFSAKYGVRAQFVRLVSAVMAQRYMAEAEAGNIAADLLFIPWPGSFPM